MTDLVAFHAEQAPRLLSYSRAAYTALGQLVADATLVGRQELVARYERVFMSALGKTDPGTGDI